MRILLVMPHSREKIKFPQLMYPALALQQVAGITPKNHSVKIIDERYERLNFNEECDIVGIYCLTYHANRVYQIADEFRRRGVTVVLGGDHPSALPEEAKQHADAVVIGEAEETWPQLLDDFRNNRLKPFYRQNKPIDPRLIPPARREAGSNRPFIAGIEASRGCPVGCEFCAVSNRPHGRLFRPRPIENVIDEIKSIKQKFLYFYNPTSTANPGYTKALFKEMIGLNKRFTCFGNVDVLAKDEELLRLASEAGCMFWNVGFESISQETIKHMGKRTNVVEKYVKVVKKIHDYNMKILGNFIFGFDTDKPDVFDNTLERAYELNLDLAQFAILTPFPGTPLFERLEREGRILTRDWSRYTEADVVFQPKHISPEELIEGTMRCIKEFYYATNIFRRLLINKSISIIATLKMKYLDYNIYFKRKGLSKADYKIYLKNKRNI
ncbi:B12-binding domain-containing radical SAM protein [Thermococci archaeon]|nr:MAG: B12-binding domain-containing radical SAM protein [Thermococci archaeon]